MPDQTEFKLLVPEDSTAGWAMNAARKRWDTPADPSAGFFMFCGNLMCMGTTKLKALDTNKPKEITFIIRQECTFG